MSGGKQSVGHVACFKWGLASSEQLVTAVVGVACGQLILWLLLPSLVLHVSRTNICVHQWLARSPRMMRT